MLRVVCVVLMVVCVSAKSAYSLFRRINGGFAQAVANLPFEDGSFINSFIAAPAYVESYGADVTDALYKYANGDAYNVIALGDLIPPSETFQAENIWFHRGGKRSFNGLWRIHEDVNATSSNERYTAVYLNNDARVVRLARIDFTSDFFLNIYEPQYKDGIICQGVVNKVWNHPIRKFIYSMTCDGLYATGKTG